MKRSVVTVISLFCLFSFSYPSLPFESILASESTSLDFSSYQKDIEKIIKNVQCELEKTKSSWMSKKKFTVTEKRTDLFDR